jgi:predicted metalloprotease with PDZ domain
MERKRHRMLGEKRGRAALALLVGTSATAVTLALVGHEIRAEFRGHRSEAAAIALDAAIGATVEPLDRSTARGLGIEPREDGLVITSVAETGPAARAGIRAGDVIEQIDTIRVSSLGDAAVALMKAHDHVELRLNRLGHYAIVTMPISTALEGRAKTTQGGEQ